MPVQIRPETEASQPLAVIFYGGYMATKLAEVLEKQNLSARLITTSDQTLSIFDHPTYIYFFVSPETPFPFLKDQLNDALKSATHHNAKLVLIYDNIDSERENKVEELVSVSSWPVIRSKINGILPKNSDLLVDSISKIARLAFTTRKAEILEITGSQNVLIQQSPIPTTSSIQDVLSRLEMAQKHRRPSLKKPRALVPLFIIASILILIFTPLFAIFGLTIFSFKSLENVQSYSLKGDYKTAKIEASEASDGFKSAKSFASMYSFLNPLLPIDKIYSSLNIGQSISESAISFTTIAPDLARLPKIILGDDTDTSIDQHLYNIRLELSSISDNLGLIDAQLSPLLTPKTLKFLGFIGLSQDKVLSYQTKLTQGRSLIDKVNTLLTIAPNILTQQGRKTYLLIFQNSTELRPTGGFIGSYAIVHVERGKILDYKINDIYTADGQLKGRIAPPDEVLHFLGQPNWYMRDSNFSPDFPLTAQRLEWFLEKETGQRADGVIAIDLNAVQKILTATGPLTLPDLNDTVTAGTFFQKAEYASEINFFPGSNQKRDYLGAVAQAILDKITQDPNKDLVALGKAFSDSLSQKNILFYFNAPELQNVLKNNAWSGSLSLPYCQGPQSNCLMVIDSNFGANKANYFINRQIQVNSLIGKAGDIETTVKINYQNNSPSSSWPGGRYKNYLRILIPNNSRIIKADIDDGRTTTISSILTADILAKTRSDQFLVFKTNELAISEKTATVSAGTSYGMLIEVPIQSQKTVTLTYRPPYKLDLLKKNMSYTLNLIKQPGTTADVVDFTLDYPSFLKPQQPVDIPQHFVYNTDLATDKLIEVKFTK